MEKKIGCEHSNYKIDCPNMKKVEEDNEYYEWYKCTKCNAELKAYYEDMR